MNKIVMRYLIITFSYLSILYPMWARGGTIEWSMGNITADLFPMLGLAAFALLWLHVVGAGLQDWLKKYVDFEGFVHRTSPIIFALMLLHPLLLLVTFSFNVRSVLLSCGLLYVSMGLMGLLLLLTYDIGRAQKNKEFFIRHWNKVLVISTIGFFLIFFHSISLGSDLQSGPLRFVWIFYGATAFTSALHAYVLKPLLENR